VIVGEIVVIGTVVGVAVAVAVVTDVVVVAAVVTVVVHHQWVSVVDPRLLITDGTMVDPHPRGWMVVTMEVVIGVVAMIVTIVTVGIAVHLGTTVIAVAGADPALALPTDIAIGAVALHKGAPVGIMMIGTGMITVILVAIVTDAIAAETEMNIVDVVEAGSVIGVIGIADTDPKQPS